MFPWQRTKELGNLSMFLLTQRNPDVCMEILAVGNLAVTFLAGGHWGCKRVSVCVRAYTCIFVCYAANGI